MFHYFRYVYELNMYLYCAFYMSSDYHHHHLLYHYHHHNSTFNNLSVFLCLRRGTVIVKDSRKSEWVYIVVSVRQYSRYQVFLSRNKYVSLTLVVIPHRGFSVDVSPHPTPPHFYNIHPNNFTVPTLLRERFFSVKACMRFEVEEGTHHFLASINGYFP